MVYMCYKLNGFKVNLYFIKNIYYNLHMKKIGRPQSIKRIDILDKCVEKYWEVGIDNISFNNIIKYSCVSKSTIYRLFGDEDDLQYYSLKHYYENIIKEWHTIIEEHKDVNTLIDEYLTGIVEGKHTPCLYNKSIMVKKNLGKRSINLLDTIDKSYKKSWYIAIKKSSNKNLDDKHLKSLAAFIAAQVALINTLKQNKVSRNELLLIISVIKKSVKFSHSKI